MEVAGIDTIRGVEAVHLVFLIDGGALWYHIHQKPPVGGWDGTTFPLASLRESDRGKKGPNRGSGDSIIYPDSGFLPGKPGARYGGRDP